MYNSSERISTRLTTFISKVEKDTNGNYKKYFDEYNKALIALKDLNTTIGMKEIKDQVVDQLDRYVREKINNKYDQSERKHIILSGPPGCGKTTVAKKLANVWVYAGFLGSTQTTNDKSKTFGKLQDDIIRKQKLEIKGYREKIKNTNGNLTSINRIKTNNNRTLNNILALKNKNNDPLYGEIIRDVSQNTQLLEKMINSITYLNKPIETDFRGMGIENDPRIYKAQVLTDVPFYIYKKVDLVSPYVGGTTPMTTAALKETLFSVTLFDEAYNICNSSFGHSDNYGKEALTVINEFMEENSDKVIFIFAGYKEQIRKNLFSAQPGLESRFAYTYEISRYTAEELVRIYIQRLEFRNWTLRFSPELVELFEDNIAYFKNQGRDMDNLATYTKNVASKSFSDEEEYNTVITNIKIIIEAIEVFKEQRIFVNEGRGERGERGGDSDPFERIRNLIN